MTLRLALRILFKTPFVTIVAIVSLALGIGGLRPFEVAEHRGR